MMDSYISDELLVETNHDVLRHLEKCPRCRDDMELRRWFKEQLRRVIVNAPESHTDPIFVTRLSANLKESSLRPGFFGGLVGSGRLVAASFACLLLLVAGIAVWLNRPRNDQNAANANTGIVEAVKASWAELAKLAVGDHENCAVEFHLKEDPITLDEAATKFGAYNKDLDSVMMAAFKSDGATGDVEFLESHSCVYEGRRFAHVVVKRKGEVVSILVADTDLPANDYGVESALFETAAGFFAGHHAVFVVSKLAANENASLAGVIAPAVRAHIQKPNA